MANDSADASTDSTAINSTHQTTAVDAEPNTEHPPEAKIEPIVLLYTQAVFFFYSWPTHLTGWSQQH